jgi:hypothetical protein
VCLTNVIRKELGSENCESHVRKTGKETHVRVEQAKRISYARSLSIFLDTFFAIALASKPHRLYPLLPYLRRARIKV